MTVRVSTSRQTFDAFNLEKYIKEKSFMSSGQGFCPKSATDIINTGGSYVILNK